MCIKLRNYKVTLWFCKDGFGAWRGGEQGGIGESGNIKKRIIHVSWGFFSPHFGILKYTPGWSWISFWNHFFRAFSNYRCVSLCLSRYLWFCKLRVSLIIPISIICILTESTNKFLNFVWDRISLCILDYPGLTFLDQAPLELTEICLLLPP